MKFTSVKVSNNALNFLLAQYRAIFKRAYVKGLASAVLLTAGLAAGQAQAYTDLTQKTEGYWDKVSDAQDLTVSGETTFTSSSLDTTKVYDDITITNGGTLKNSGTSSEIETIIVKGDITINNGGNLTLSTNDAHIAGFDLGTTGRPADDKTETAVGTLYNEKGGTLTIGSGSSNSYIQLHSAVLETGSETIINGSGAATASQSTVGTAAYLFAGFGEDPGKLEIQKDATVEIKDFGYLGIASKGTMTINGNVKIKAEDQDSFAGIRAADDNSYSWSADTNSTVVLNKDAVITVQSGDGKAMLLAPQVNISGATVEVEEGATFYLSGDLKTYKESGSAMFAASAGQFNMTSGKLDIDGTLVISNGKYDADSDKTPDFNEKELVNTLTITDGELNGTGKVQVAGKFVATSGIVDAFLSGKDADGTANSNDGHFEFSGDKTVFEVTGSEQFDLAKYSFSGGGTTTDFILTGSGTIAGENLAVSYALTQNGKADGTPNDAAAKLTIDAVNLTLGSNEYSGDTTLGFNSATARNLTLQGSGNTFTLADAVTVAAIDEVDNPFLTKEGKLKVAAEGQLNLEDNTTITGADKGMTIAAGNYKSSDDITIKSGSLTVGNQQTGADGYGVDASLALTGKLTLDNSTGANTITIAGNGSQTIKADTDVTVEDRTATSTLDLTGVDKVTITRGSNNTTFNVNGGGELLLSTSAFNSLINNVADADTAKSGAEVVVSGGGYVYVEGSVQDYTGSKALDVTKLTSGSSPTTDKIRFSGDGTLEARGTIWLADTNGSSTLNIGSGALRAQTFRLDVFGTTADNKTTYSNFVVQTGELTAGAHVESSHDNAIQLGNGTTGATLNLGYIEDNVDKWGQKTYTYTTSSATGSVDTNLVLSGGSATGSGSALNVVYGDWSAKDITVTQGTVTVGNDAVYDASLTGNKLTLNTGAEATVNSNGKATFNELTMTAGTLTVNGEMIVNGKHVAADPDASPAVTESWGVALGTGTINVTGRNASLTFGSDAVSAITLNSDNKTVNVATGTFAKTIKVEDFATLGLNFAEGTTFNADTLKDLRTELLSNSTNGNALTEGYINLGAARIEGVTVSDGKINWEQLKDFADIDQLQDIITDDMSNATLVNANGTDTIQGNVGNIQLAGNQQTVNLGDSYLANSSANNENGNFVFNETNPAQAGNANIVQGAHVTLANGGNIGAVSLATGNSGADGETILNVVSQDPAAESSSRCGHVCPQPALTPPGIPFSVPRRFLIIYRTLWISFCPVVSEYSRVIQPS